MKKYIIISFAIMFVVCGSMNLFAQDLIGPKIHGFCLGMTLEQINDVASKEGYTIETIYPYGDKDYPAYSIKRQGKPIATIYFFEFLKYSDKNHVNEIIFYPAAFNTNKIDENFATKFIQHYKIPVNKNLIREDKRDFIISVPDEGYEVGFDEEYGTYVKILKITKSSNLNFK